MKTTLFHNPFPKFFPGNSPPKFQPSSTQIQVKFGAQFQRTGEGSGTLDLGPPSPPPLSPPIGP